MTEYEVTWGINLDADSPRDAVLKAYAMLTSDDPANLARVFEVAATAGGTTQTVDLSPGAGRPMTPDEITAQVRRDDQAWVEPDADNAVLSPVEVVHDALLHLHDTDALDITAADIAADVIKAYQRTQGTYDQPCEACGESTNDGERCPATRSGAHVQNDSTRVDEPTLPLSLAVPLSHMLEQAAGLLDPSDPDAGVCEYRRALVELICQAFGLPTDEYRETVDAEIGRRIR